MGSAMGLDTTNDMTELMADYARDPDFIAAVQHQNEGRLDEAAALYSRIIAKNNQQFVAIHNLAAIVSKKGYRARALGLFELASKINPQYAEAVSNWAYLLKEDKQFDAAIEKFEQACALNSGLLHAHINLADLYREQGRFEDALGAYQRALDSKPDSIELLNNLGVTYRRLGDNKKAVESFERALEIKPDYVDALINQGNAMLELGLTDEAIERLRRGTELSPKLAAAHNNLGIALAKAGRHEEAMVCYETAISLSGDNNRIMTNLADALNSSGKSEEAILKFEEAIALDPEYAFAHNNMGNALKDTGNYEKAEASFLKAIELSPDFAEPRANLGYVYLMRGRFREGWEGYAWRGKVRGEALARRTYPQPAWDGGDVTGQTVFVYPEQGLGDIVQFSRYTALLKARGARVVMEVPNQLHELLKTLPDVDQFSLQNTPPPEFDFHVSIMDLPQLFETTLETIPDMQGYVKADELRIDAWKDRLGPKSGNLRVGLVWSGNPKHTNDHNRSLPLEYVRPFVEMEGVAVYSLQVGKNGEAQALFGGAITDLAPQLTSFAETAAVMMNLDLVISVDTSPLHVAGALGVPTWGLIPFIPDWRWLLERDDSPWYPSMRLFRQDATKDWRPVVNNCVEALQDLTAKPF